MFLATGIFAFWTSVLCTLMLIFVMFFEVNLLECVVWALARILSDARTFVYVCNVGFIRRLGLAEVTVELTSS